MLSDHNGIKPEVNAKKITVNSPIIWKLNTLKKTLRKLEYILNLTKMEIQYISLCELQKKKC